MRVHSEARRDLLVAGILEDQLAAAEHDWHVTIRELKTLLEFYCGGIAGYVETDKRERIARQKLLQT